jgi:hypothetical protein
MNLPNRSFSKKNLPTFLLCSLARIGQLLDLLSNKLFESVKIARHGEQILLHQSKTVGDGPAKQIPIDFFSVISTICQTNFNSSFQLTFSRHFDKGMHIQEPHHTYDRELHTTQAA